MNLYRLQGHDGRVMFVLAPHLSQSLKDWDRAFEAFYGNDAFFRPESAELVASGCDIVIDGAIVNPPSKDPNFL